jgi:hypothetical protein
MLFKTCKVCDQTKQYLSEFQGQPAKSGWNGRECYACKTERQKFDRATPEGREAANAASRKHSLNPENRVKRYAAKNAWQRANPAYNCAKSMEYHTDKLQRIPSWANLDVIKVYYIYAEALGLVVDHIVPLRGKTVCGLHVENNLQLLTAAENSSKGNRWV